MSTCAGPLQDGAQPIPSSLAKDWAAIPPGPFGWVVGRRCLGASTYRLRGLRPVVLVGTCSRRCERPGVGHAESPMVDQPGRPVHVLAGPARACPELVTHTGALLAE